MKEIKSWKGSIAIFLFAVFALLVVANWHGLRAQQAVAGAVAVQQVQPLYTCNQSITATGAANSGVVATLTPGITQRVYLCSVYIGEAANGAVTGAAGPVPIFTSTGLPSALVWWGNNATQGTGTFTLVADEVYPLLIPGALGTAVTIGVNSTGQSTDNVTIRLTGFFAP